MKKTFFLIIVVFCLSVSFFTPAAAAESEYDLFKTGRVTFEISVPADFNNVIYVTLMDDEGGFQQFAVLPESDYRLVENITCGPYRISAFVDNDPRMEYTVMREQDYITVTDKKDLDVKFNVIGGPADEEGNTVTAPTPPPDEIGPTEEFSEPFEMEAETEPSVPTEPEEEPEPSEPKATEPQASEPDDGEGEKPFWQKLLVSAIVSLIFAGIVIFIVFILRKYFE